MTDIKVCFELSLAASGDLRAGQKTGWFKSGMRGGPSSPETRGSGVWRLFIWLKSGGESGIFF